MVIINRNKTKGGVFYLNPIEKRLVNKLEKNIIIKESAEKKITVIEYPKTIQNTKHNIFCFGVQSQLDNNRHCLFCDIDNNDKNAYDAVKSDLWYRTVRPNILGIKTTNGYWLLSLNAYPERFIIDFMVSNIKILDRRHIGFGIMDKSWTIRLSKRYPEELKPKLIEWQQGEYKISYGHYIIFNELLNNKLKIDNLNILVDYGIILNGYTDQKKDNPHNKFKVDCKCD